MPSLLRPWVASRPHFCHIPYPQIRKSTSGRSQNMRTSSPCEAFPARRWAFLQRQGRGTCSSGEVTLKLPACCLLPFDGGREVASSHGDTDNAWPLATSTSFLDKASSLFQGPTQGCALEALSPVTAPQMSALSLGVELFDSAGGCCAEDMATSRVTL